MTVSPPTAAALLLALCAGFATGWWWRGDGAPLAPSEAYPGGANATAGSSAPPGPTAADADSPQQPIDWPAQPAPEPAGLSDVAQLEGLLSRQRFDDATAFYYRALQQDPTAAPRLYPVVSSYVQRCAERCSQGAFLDLMDAWLGTFYDDIPMLLALSDYQGHLGQPEEAASTLLLAQTYAAQPGDRDSIQRSLVRLTKTTDDRLAGDGRWPELLGYYEYLDTLDFTRREFNLRRVTLYRQLGEHGRATALLDRLEAEDDGSDPAWTAALQSRRPDEPVAAAPSASPADAVPLQRRGNGYVLEAVINDRDPLKLLVDTGASLTALGRDAFRRQYRPDFQLLGTRLFNTANGYTRGDVYLARSLTLGEERLEDIQVAVLDLEGLGEIDGLLGMNALRNFRFSIDQDNAALHLQRR